MSSFRSLIHQEYDMKYRGEIKNEKGKVIFSRKGNFENREKCIKALQQRVCVDIPDEYSFVYNAIHGGSSENSPYCLKRYYTDISKLTFYVEELN